MKRWTFLIFCCTIIFSCNESETSGKKIEEMKIDEAASIIRNPVSAIDEVDAEFVPEMTFEETTHDFGSVKEGEKVEYTFKFKNTGEVPLLIGNAKSTCGCTVPTYPKGYVQPGKTGKIKVVFDTKSLSGFQTKPITITSNTVPRDTKLFIKGLVEEHKH